MRQLLKFVDTEQNDCDLYLDAILYSYHVSRHNSTKQPPSLLIDRCQPRLVIEFNSKLASSEVKVMTLVADECEGRNVEIGLDAHMQVLSLPATH